MERQKYVVRVVRPVFQAAYIEVEGKNENEAANIAYEAAGRIPEDQWLGRYNPDDYSLDVHCVQSGETPEGHAFSGIDFPLYIVVNTDQYPPLGKGACQPWMDYVEPMTVAAIYTQWIDLLLDERVDYYQEAIEYFEEILKAWKGTDQKVAPLVPPADRRADIELVETLLETIRLLKEVD